MERNARTPRASQPGLQAWSRERGRVPLPDSGLEGLPCPLQSVTARLRKAAKELARHCQRQLVVRAATRRAISEQSDRGQDEPPRPCPQIAAAKCCNGNVTVNARKRTARTLPASHGTRRQAQSRRSPSPWALASRRRGAPQPSASPTPVRITTRFRIPQSCRGRYLASAQPAPRSSLPGCAVWLPLCAVCFASGWREYWV